MDTEFEVCHVRSSAGLYGAESVILGLLPALEPLGVRSTLHCLDNQYALEQALPAKAEALGIRTRRVPCRGRFDFATINALRRTIAAQPAVVLHVHDYKSALVAWLARGRRRIPIVATSHGQFSSTASLHLYHHLELSLMRRFDRVCIVADDMRDVLARAGVDAAKVRLIENGIDTARFVPGVRPVSRAEFALAPDAIVFGAAMRLTEQKNPLGLIDAFARVAAEIAGEVLLVVGDGPMRAATLERAAALGISGRVRIAGSREQMERIYALFDVFVLPSLYEGLPLALLEAMSAGCSIVATRVGHVPTVLEGLPCVQVAAGDVVALADGMCSAVGQAAPALRARVVDRYSVTRMARDYASVYDDVWRSRERKVA